MILDTSNINLNNTQIINDVVGQSFSFLQTIRLGNVDSKLMVIDEVSSYIKELLGDIIINTYVSIELRPNGILVRLHQNSKNLTWIITYHKLKLNNLNGIRISEGNHFIKLKEGKALDANEFFFKRIQKLKTRNIKVVAANKKNKPYYNI